MKDTSRMLKGIGDAIAVIPGAFGFAGIGFSIAASVYTIIRGMGNRDDPILVALSKLHEDFSQDFDAIEAAVKDVNTKTNVIISGIDQVLSDISKIPAKVVAEMKLTDVTQMKDKFANVQRAALQYTQGNLTSDQMMAKCDDYDVPSLFSELETILRDEKNLFGAKFGALDMSNGQVQTQLLLFYFSVIPIATNCNALKYSLASIQSDGEKIDQVIKLVYDRLSWYLTPPDRTIHVRERFNPFASAFDTDGLKDTPEWSLSLSFRAYSFAPPHAACFEAVDEGHRLARLDLPPTTKLPKPTMFCVKSEQTDDAPIRVAYAERGKEDDTGRHSIIQPEEGDHFFPLDSRGWNQNVQVLYVAKTANWDTLPYVTVISDFLVVEGESKTVSIDDVTAQCRAIGEGYDRDGDGHSKDYPGAPWTIFCVKYVKTSLREIDNQSGTFLADVEYNEMDAGDAWTAKCPKEGYVRDKSQITIPSKIKKQWLAGYSTIRSYAICLKWENMTTRSTPNQFMGRVWLDDSQTMADKPRKSRLEGGRVMALRPSPSAEQADQM
ncbi:hypothetical protein Poli38472_008607 [Pythium oligandrum]|uniref:Uncharacterized protein n=1 Tax=Pythium oligandrum TaxID=41045 RepID=A0A8K1C3S1_PYTOL|nr:hypothetical protein Poli38472_008607 [Pythium oligandrum]|eukprot:TMW55959.1 hypothetical protein Poli38472_008607 [Pythium oligandrum]